jgi:lysosomal acid lipase/cholesteryl ester hydrolase/gastric triacylglycerol lipase
MICHPQIFTLLGVHEFMPTIRIASWLEGQLCILQPDLCINIMAAICGYR